MINLHISIITSDFEKYKNKNVTNERICNTYINI